MVVGISKTIVPYEVIGRNRPINKVGWGLPTVVLSLSGPSETLYSLKIIETPKSFLFIWVMAIDI